MSWTIQADEAALLTAVAVEAEDLSWAMVWREADKQGNLSVPRCQSLGISNGKCTALPAVASVIAGHALQGHLAVLRGCSCCDCG